MDKEIHAMIKLLEDPDEDISRLVALKLQDMGKEIIPGLEKAWESTLNPDLQNKIENIIQSIQLLDIKNELYQWNCRILSCNRSWK